MGWLAQSLMVLSYAVLGFAFSVLMPRLGGWSPDFADLAGVVIFFSATLINVLVRVVRAESALRDRVEQLEDHGRLLRGDLERTRRDVARRDPESDKGVGSKELVSELKVLHTLLDQVMRRQIEAEERAKAAGADPSASTRATSVADTADREEALDLEGPHDLSDAADLPQPGPFGQDLVAPVREDVFDSESKGITGVRSPSGTRQKAPIVMVHDEERLLSIIRSGLSENRVDLYLQPIVALPARKTVHFECFSRVRDEDGRVVLPRHYLDMAAETGLVGTLDNLLLFRLIQLIRRLGRRKSDLKFFCNMSRHSLEDEEFFPQFIDFMVSNSEFTSRLVFEIAHDDYDRLSGDVREGLDSLARRGFSFSLDNVTDLDLVERAALGRDGFSFVKANHRLLRDSLNGGDMSVLIAGYNSHGLNLIASEVERQDDVIALIDADMPFAQGYVFGEPALSTEYDRDL